MTYSNHKIEDESEEDMEYISFDPESPSIEK